MKNIYLISFLLLFTVVSSLKAQDSHYWSSNFSTAGFIAPGAVVANNLDSGVYFLNPALMAWSTKTATSISANVYNFDHVNIKNGVGAGKDLKSTSTRIIPQLISKTFKINKDNPLTVGFALIQNPMQDFRSSQRMDKKINVLGDSYSPGAETYVGQFDENSKITETYAQLSVGKRLNGRWAAGITLEGSIRDQVTGSNFSSKAIFNTPSSGDNLFPKVASNTTYYQTNFTHVGLRFKLGLSYDAAPHHFGLLVSTPMLKVYGKGAVLSDIGINNLPLTTTTDLNLLGSTRQTGLKTTWKAPLTVSGGYAYDYGNGQLYLAAEFFNGIGPYSVLKPDDALFVKNSAADPQTSEQTSSLDLVDERKKVLNVGVGFSRKLNESVSLMLAGRTDFNYLATKDAAQGHLDLWDNYHFQVGGNFKRRKFNLRAGLQLSYGRTSSYEQPANFDNPTEANLLIGTQSMVPAKHFGAGLLLSYIHNF